MVRIRLHGRGGQGIKTGSRILGSAFFRAGFEVQDAPVYGAERRGAPMFATVRAARAPIRERGLVARPDLVLLADETLLQVPAANVLLGVGPGSVLLIHGTGEAETWRARLGIEGTVVVLTATDGTPERAESGLAGARCAGAAARLVGGIARQQLGAALAEELEPLGPAVVQRNLAQALAAFDAVAPHAGVVREGAPVSALDFAAPEWIDLPLESARASAPDIYAAATNVEVRTGLWRTMRPEIDTTRCNRCFWICSTLCPDSAIRVRPDRSPEIDLQHCKGCMICVSVCPPHAIHAMPERAAQERELARAAP